MEENVETNPISEIQPSFGKDLPGFGSRFGRPVDYLPPKNIRSDDDDEITNPKSSSQKALSQKLFISALSMLSLDGPPYADFSRQTFEGRLTPLRELQMMRWMNVVTDKKDWDVKVIIKCASLGKRVLAGEEDILFY